MKNHEPCLECQHVLTLLPPPPLKSGGKCYAFVLYYEFELIYLVVYLFIHLFVYLVIYFNLSYLFILSICLLINLFVLFIFFFRTI